MNTKHILIPLHLIHGSAHALVFARRMAMERPLSVTLLHVVDLNIASVEPSVYDQLCAEGEAALRKLARLFFGTDPAVRVVVRVGNPADEIVAEARAGAAEMIVLCGPKAPRRLRLFRRATTRRVLDGAPCPTVVLPHPGREARELCQPETPRASEEVYAFGSVAERAVAA